MFSLKKAKVAERLRSEHGRIDIIVDVDGSMVPAVAYEALIGDVSEGDEVVVNTVAVDLGLGSGGKHFVLWNLESDSVENGGEGHIVKMRYTPLQIACLAVEEEASPHRESMQSTIDIRGMPVIAGTLHSQLAPAAATLKFLKPSVKVAYIMTDGAALPIAFSDSVAELKEKGLIDTTITCGNAFGGDLETINIYSALVAAKAAAGADVVIVTMGPGIVGTDTPLGFTGIEQGQLVNAAGSLLGRPIAIPRISFADERPRHCGLSRHTLVALGVAALFSCTIAVPEMGEEKTAEVMKRINKGNLSDKHEIEVVDASMTEEAVAHFGLRVSTMGRGFREDPEFFLAAGAAAVCAIDALGGRENG